MLDLAALALCHAAQYYTLICIYSYVGFMAADLHWVADKDSAGLVTGLLGGALPLGRLFTAFLWGWAADRWGRRPVVLISMIALCLGHIAFGFCRPLWLAVAVRLMMGCLNGWSTLTGLLAHEVGGPIREKKALGYIYASACAMMTVAPAVGAGLYGIDLLGREFPAAAPSLVGAILSGSAALCGWLFIPETLPAGAGQADGLTPVSEGGGHKAVCWLASRWPFPLLLGLRTSLGIVEMATNDVVPLFLIASIRSGGLQLPVARLGVVLMLSAALSAVYIALISARVQTLLGNPAVIIGGALVQVLMLWAFLIFPALPVSNWPLPVLFSIPLTIFYIAYQHIFSGLIATFNAAVSHHPDQAGTLNGVATTCMTAGMAAGPLATAPAFAAAIQALPPVQSSGKLQRVLLDGASLVWGLLSLLLLAIAALSWRYVDEIRRLDMQWRPLAAQTEEPLVPEATPRGTVAEEPTKQHGLD